MYPCVGLCSLKNISCTNEGGQEDSAKVPVAVPEPTEIKHKPKDAEMIGGGGALSLSRNGNSYPWAFRGIMTSLPTGIEL